MGDPIERFERAATEARKLAEDCGVALPPELTEEQVADFYRRLAATVLRHGAGAQIPDYMSESGKGPGACARGYCRSQPACPAGFCAGVC